MLKVVMLAMIGIFFAILIIQEIIFKNLKKDTVGKPPIDARLFKIGKLSMFLTWIALIIQLLGLNIRVFNIHGIWEAVPAVILLIGLLYVVFSFAYLGTSNRMGLPTDETKLAMKGIYRFTRNPMYVGFLMLSLASCFYTANPVIWALTLTAVLIHHRIVLAEESFLNKRFGKAYSDYCRKVRRYI